MALHSIGRGLRRNHGNRGRMVKACGLRVPRKVAFVTAYGLIGMLALIGPELSLWSDPTLGRRLSNHLSTKCIHDTYISSIDEAVLMPPVPEQDMDYVPTHIQLCFEWLRRDSLPKKDLQMITVLEHRDICLDWSAPHYAMLEIISSMILNVYMRRARYRHACPVHREYDEGLRGYDWSPVQTIFQEPNMGGDKELLGGKQETESYFLDVCKVCLDSYDPEADKNRVRSRKLHHCFAFPEDATKYNAPLELKPMTAPTPVPLPSKPIATGNVAPISTITKVLRTRLWHSATEWKNVTQRPPEEVRSGTVILVDSGSKGIDPSVYIDFIKPSTTSINIIAGPLCYTAHLPTGQLCIDYVRDLKNYFKDRFPLEGNGFEGGPGVDYKISASTAAAFSRAILAKYLICPPNNFACLLPAMGKQSKPVSISEPPTESIILEEPGPGVGANFFDKVGTNGNTEVILLAIIPPVVEGTPDAPPPVEIPQKLGVPLAPAFTESQAPIEGDGFIKDAGPAPAPADVDAAVSKTSLESYKEAEEKLPPVFAVAAEENPPEESPLVVQPNVLIDYSNTEKVPTEEEVDSAVEAGAPLNSNTPEIPPAELEEEAAPAAIVSTELATDMDSDLAPRVMTDETLRRLALAREESVKRVFTGYDKTYLFEVPCPSADDAGGVVVVDDGYAITDDNETVIVSDGTGTVTFESPITITTVPIMQGEIVDPATGETRIEEYITIVDPIIKEPVNITAAGIVTNPDSSLTVTNPVGQLITVPETQQGLLITMGEASHLETNSKNLDANPTHTIIEGKVISTGNENIPSDGTGTLVMDEDGSLAITASTEEFSGFLDVNPEKETTGEYQQVKLSDLNEAVTPLATYDNCKHVDFSPPIHVIPFTQIISFVMFDVYQTFKGELDWIAIDSKGAMNLPMCVKYDNMPFGRVPTTFLASCEDGIAIVDIYIHDYSTMINQDYSKIDSRYDITGQIPDRCYPSTDFGNKCFFRYALDCTGTAGKRRRLEETAVPAEGMSPFRDQKGQKNKPLTHMALTPKNVVISHKPREEKRFLFAQNILRRCPELGKKKIYDHFKFGGRARANKILLPTLQ